MEERINNLEKQVLLLTELCVNQQETINGLVNCINHISGMLERGTKIDNDLFTYCKELRKEMNKLKEKVPV